MLIDSTYFVGQLYLPSHLLEKTSIVNPIIEKTEKSVLIDALGYDLYKSFLPFTNVLPKPEVIILDPPRGGMHKTTIRDVLELSPEKIVYVSCNPTTQARDIKLLVEGGYNLTKMRPVDMFPHTYHIENVALLLK